VYGDPQRGIDYACECPKDTRAHFCKAPSESEFEAQVQLLVLKNSNGQIGRIKASWHGPTTRME
jgi:hypothetical protein